MRKMTRTRNPEAGQSLVLVGIAMVALIGILGLAVDMGYLRYVKRELQTAADESAYAGAMDVSYGTVSTAGLAAASENGFANGVNGVTVTINNPPQHGPYAGSGFPTYVESIITQPKVPTFFSRVFGINSMSLTATSVAAGGNNCIYGLDATNNHTTLALNFAVIDSTCGVVDNSNLGGGLFGFGLGLLCAPSIQLKGTENVAGTCGSGYKPAKPVKITTAAPDPFASIPAPFYIAAPPTCVANTNQDVVAANNVTIGPSPIFCNGTVITNKTGITVTPGTYWGSATGLPAFQIQNSTVTFQPGTYNIVSRTAGTPGIKLISTIFNTNQVSFGGGTYTIYGGINDSSAFGTAVNWNNTSGTPSEMILVGGGLTLTGSSGNGNGAIGTSTGGVMFYNTGTSGAGSVTSYGPIRSFFDFSGGFCGAKCQLSAPNSGTYAGILFFNDRFNTATVACGAGFGAAQAGGCFSGNTNFGTGQISHAGAYYFANTTVAFSFDFGFGAPYSFLVANDIDWFFAFTFNKNYTNLPNGSPIRQGGAVIVQ